MSLKKQLKNALKDAMRQKDAVGKRVIRSALANIKLAEVEKGAPLDETTLLGIIQKELIYFDGHFEGNPVLPGVVQVHWAEAFGRRLLKLSGQFKCLEVIKFQKIIVPGHNINIILKYDDAKDKLSFKYESERGVHSSGRICFGQ